MSVGPVRHLFTVEDYYRMGDAGLFDTGPRVELVGGEIIEMSPIGRRHAACVNRLTALITEALGRTVVVSVQNSLRLGDISEPEPDVVVLKPRPDFYEAFIPGPQDTLLVIEVSESSLRWDRGAKRQFYAAAGIVEVWVVDVAAGVVEVATEPGPEGYGGIQCLGPGETVTAAAIPDLTLAIAAVLG